MKKEFLLYTAISGVAWLLDVAVLYLAALYLDMPVFLAAAIAYMIGLIVHYMLSIRYVFTYRQLADKPRAEILLYALTGVVGIVLSAGIVHIGSQLQLPLIWSKIAATLITFVVVFIIRKVTLFSDDGQNLRGAP